MSRMALIATAGDCRLLRISHRFSHPTTTPTCTTPGHYGSIARTAAEHHTRPESAAQCHRGSMARMAAKTSSKACICCIPQPILNSAVVATAVVTAHHHGSVGKGGSENLLTRNEAVSHTSADLAQHYHIVYSLPRVATDALPKDGSKGITRSSRRLPVPPLSWLCCHSLLSPPR